MSGFKDYNAQEVELPSAARTTTQTGLDHINHNNRGIQVVVDLTEVASGPSLVVTIQGRDANGKYYTLLTSAALVAAATTLLTIYPGLTAVNNVTVSQVLPREFRIVVTAGNSNTCTYSVGYNLLK